MIPIRPDREYIGEISHKELEEAVIFGFHDFGGGGEERDTCSKCGHNFRHKVHLRTRRQQCSNKCGRCAVCRCAERDAAEPFIRVTDVIKKIAIQAPSDFLDGDFRKCPYQENYRRGGCPRKDAESCEACCIDRIEKLINEEESK